MISKMAALITLSILSSQASAKNPVNGFAGLMQASIAAKDAPATCWYLGLADGYVRGLASTGHAKAAEFAKTLRKTEGKCGGENKMDLKETFTEEEWIRLSEIQKKLQSAQL